MQRSLFAAAADAARCCPSAVQRGSAIDVPEGRKRGRAAACIATLALPCRGAGDQPEQGNSVGACVLAGVIVRRRAAGRRHKADRYNRRRGTIDKTRCIRKCCRFWRMTRTAVTPRCFDRIIFDAPAVVPNLVWRPFARRLAPAMRLRARAQAPAKGRAMARVDRRDQVRRSRPRLSSPPPVS